MSSLNHRLAVKNLLLGVTATLDDNVTAAQIIVVYRDGPENFKHFFYINDYDAVISVERPSRRRNPVNMSLPGMVPLRYDAIVPVYVTAIDKSTVTATILLRKIRESIENVLETNSEQDDFNISIGSDAPMNTPMGGYDPLWTDIYRLIVRPVGYM